jgi:cytoskeletal protein CcmA (bactofilin family)
MFNSNKPSGMSKTNTADSPSINMIGSGTVIEGDIKANGDMRIDGNIKGSINVKGKLVIGPTGVVDGEVPILWAPFGQKSLFLSCFLSNRRPNSPVI